MVDTTDPTLELLREIRDAVRDQGRDLGARIDETNQRLEETRDTLSGRLDFLAESMIRSFTDLTDRVGRIEGHVQRIEGRLDHFHDFMGSLWRDHEARLRALEAQTSQRPPPG